MDNKQIMNKHGNGMGRFVERTGNGTVFLAHTVYGTFRKIISVLLQLHVLNSVLFLLPFSVPCYYRSPFHFFCRLRLNGTFSPPGFLVTCNTYVRTKLRPSS